MPTRLSLPDARLVFLNRQGLAAPPNRALGKAGLLRLIDDLGFVQVDSIQWVERAHHQILFARNQTYRPADLKALLEEDGALFEHWTHDASIIPCRFFKYWKHRFRWEEETIVARWQRWRGEGFHESFEETYARIREGGRVLSRDLKTDDHASGGWWNWHPSKTALESLWRMGRLAIAGRENFQKIYDLTERVIPAHHYEEEVSRADFIDWCCRAALERLGFATPGEIAAFFDLVTPEEAKAWLMENRDRLEEVLIDPGDGSRPRACHALAGFADSLSGLETPPARIRVLSPFDPLIRDRNRAHRLFSFHYRIEVFVPEPKRVYGYYVFPLLEGDRLIGRIDMKANRRAGSLDVRRFWLEPGLRASAGRMERLEAELVRQARFAGLQSVAWPDDARAPAPAISLPPV
ncbi:winged helix-turn-helix domain-containing protein [Rhizobium sp. SG2393]|uniref:winged helix-turn-helix domain-containing protein n=1 Tax=Rhizobium sp. SG2393 TaxID=3276279 RepID=UPI003671A7FB